MTAGEVKAAIERLRESAQQAAEANAELAAVTASLATTSRDQA